ncbi:MAG: hypothetical protein FWE86_03430, partial [Oscillospiraceae bacterium]|nr:hypothetical protein [Oscillospiraceae bacterium]
DTTTVARLMLDAEIFAKQIEERAISEANKKLAEKEAQIRVLELQKEGALSSIRQLANDLTALTTVGGQESAFAERNQPGSHKEHGGQQFTFVSASVPGAGGYFPRIESNSDTA